MEQVKTKDQTDLSVLSILLIEDDPSMRDLLAELVTEIGITDIHQMSNALDALKFIDENPTWRGVILCDWNMPRMSGATFYKQIQNTHHDIPFIMVTGRNDEGSVMMAKDNGIYAYLLKPVSLEELERKINRVACNHASHLAEMSKDIATSLYTI